MFNQSYFVDLKHTDVFSQIGLAMCERKAVPINTTGSCAFEPGILVVTPVNTTYLFSTISGKVWKITGGVCTELATNPNGAHSGATFFNNKIYYAARTNVLGFFDAESEANRTDTWKTLPTASSPYIPMVPNFNLSLYIGSGYQVSNVSYNNTFSSTSLNFPTDYRITDMRPFGESLAVGGYAQNQGFVTTWFPYNDTFRLPDFIDGSVDFWFGSSNSNVIMAVAGHEGDIFHFTGSQAVLRWNIPFVRTAPNPYADSVQDGKAVFAIGGRVYTYHQKMAGTPFGLVHLYTCSGGEDATITSMNVWDNPAGPDVLYISWSDGTNHGLDIVSNEEREIATIVTPVLEYHQESSHQQRDAYVQQEPSRVLIHYYDYPNGTDIAVWLNVNNSGWRQVKVNPQSTQMMVEVDEMPAVWDNMYSEDKYEANAVRTVQVRVVMTPKGKLTPSIRSIQIL